MRTGSRAAMFVNSDFSDLLRLFNANQVRYLVIGGYPLIHYAEPRFTNRPNAVRLSRGRENPVEHAEGLAWNKGKPKAHNHL
jgi:hypothetical protein